MEVADRLIPVSRLLHIRIAPNRAHGDYQGTPLGDAVNAAACILVQACNELIWGRFEPPPDAPGIEPFGMCIRIIVYPRIDYFSVRLFSLRSQTVGLSHHYRWRVNDAQSLLHWWRLEEVHINDIATTMIEHDCLQNAEPGVIAILKEYLAVNPVDFVQTSQALK